MLKSSRCFSALSIHSRTSAMVGFFGAATTGFGAVAAGTPAAGVDTPAAGATAGFTTDGAGVVTGFAGLAAGVVGFAGAGVCACANTLSVRPRRNAILILERLWQS